MVLDTYRAIILTVDIYVVAIYCLPYSGGHKVFDSHRRDLPGMRHLYGTCTLIEIDSWINLVQYFHIHKGTNQWTINKKVNFSM